MTLNEARELVNGPLWPSVRDRFLATGELAVFPKGDLRRLEYLPEETRRQIELWREAIGKVDEWRKIVDGAKVRELKEAYPGVYPDVFRYAAYFSGKGDFTMKLLKLKFPEAYQLCCS